MIKGSCLCGQIKFQCEEIPGVTYNCHCSRCRKSSGAAFATQVFAEKETLKFPEGENKIKEYQSKGGIRAFCSECGSRLMNYGNEGVDYLSIAASAIDGSFDTKPAAGECFTADKCEWVKLLGDVPDFEGLPNKNLIHQ